MNKSVSHILLLILLFAALTPTVRAQEDEPYIETYADRTIIFPQLMHLRGDETLMDVLELYPEVLVPGYGDALANYQLRMDNVKMLGDMRTLLTQIKAKDIRRVMVVDNPGVGKGKTGLDGVIDINMMPVGEGLGGFAEVQVGTKGYVLPALNLVYGSSKSSIYLNSTLDYTSHDRNHQLGEHVDLRVDHRFGKRDRVFVDFGQEFSRYSDPLSLDLERSVQGRIRYFHNFNDRGTELTVLSSLQSISSPGRAVCSPQPIDLRRSTETRVPVYLVELNTPLLHHPLPSGREGVLQMMLGYEGNAVLQKTTQGLSASALESSSLQPDATSLDMHLSPSVANNDVYLQLDYKVGGLRLTVGDRFVHYHYTERDSKWRGDKFGNHFHASIIATPAPRHEVQLAYYHKYINPQFTQVFPGEWADINPSSLEMMLMYVGNPHLDAAGVDLYKLTYGYQRRGLSVRLSARYRNIDGLPTLTTRTTAPWASWIGSVSEEQVMFDASLSWRQRRVRIAAHGSCVMTHNDRYCVIGLSPTLILPYDIILGADAKYYSNHSPLRRAYNRPWYGSLRVDKTFATRFDALVQWHDILNPAHRALLVGLRYNFS